MYGLNLGNVSTPRIEIRYIFPKQAKALGYITRGTVVSSLGSHPLR